MWYFPGDSKFRICGRTGRNTSVTIIGPRAINDNYFSYQFTGESKFNMRRFFLGGLSDLAVHVVELSDLL